MRGKLGKPTMARTHFQFIADTIGEIRGLSPYERACVARAFAAALPRTNPAFDASHFMLAASAAILRTP